MATRSSSTNLQGDLASECKVIDSFLSARRAEFKPLLVHFLFTLKDRGLTEDESEEWAEELLAAWAEAKTSLEEAKRVFLEAAATAGKDAAVEALWRLLSSSASSGGEVVSLAARKTADFFLAQKEVSACLKHLEKAKWALLSLEGWDEPELVSLAVDALLPVCASLCKAEMPGKVSSGSSSSSFGTGAGAGGFKGGLVRMEKAFAWKLALRHPDWDPVRARTEADSYVVALERAGYTYSGLLRAFHARKEVLGPEDDLIEWRKEMFRAIYGRYVHTS